jgi:hypothetical protein
MFNLKHNRLPSGSLIRFKDDYRLGMLYLYGPNAMIAKGSIGLVIEHEKPVYIKVLVEEKIVRLDFAGRVPLHGYVSDIELFQLPLGKKLEKW